MSKFSESNPSQQAAEHLGGASIATIRRLEKERRLKPIRLSRSPTAQVFFKAADVAALIEGTADAEA
jgi:hypothetical protein